MENLKPSERIVGRRYPKEPQDMDRYLARYLRQDGTPCEWMCPKDDAMRVCHDTARKKRWIEPARTSKDEEHPSGIPRLWRLTHAGMRHAEAARYAIMLFEQKEAAWTKDLLASQERQRHRLRISEKESDAFTP